MNRLSFLPILTNACVLVGRTLLGAGAAEAGTCRVAVNGLAGNDGTTWANALPLQGALQSPACTDIWVASTSGPTSAARSTFRYAATDSVPIR